nr:MURC protein [Bos taurus]
MENAIKSVQIDLLKFSQSHSNTGYVINKLFEKTRKVSAHIKDVKARVEKQQTHVKKVEAKQEEIMKKNKFRVVIFQEEVQCPTSLSVVKDRSLTESPEEVDEIFDTPVDLSSDEEYFVEESRSARLKSQARSALITSKRHFPKKTCRRRGRILTRK